MTSTPQSSLRRALVIGASRGLGLGLAGRFLDHGWTVVATERAARPSAALHALAGPHLMLANVDIDDVSSILALRDELAGFRFDVVFVNAGMLSDPSLPYADQVLQVMRTNLAGAMLATESFEPLVADGGVLAVMSSRLGSISGNTTGGWEPYRSSKAALNQSLRSFAAARPAMPYALAAISPGWVRTEMGGPDAALDVATSTAGMVGVVESLLGKTGLVFVDYKGNELPW